MRQNYSRHLINALRNEAKKDLDKESLIAQCTLLINKSNPKTLELISCQLSLLESFMEDGE